MNIVLHSGVCYNADRKSHNDSMYTKNESRECSGNTFPGFFFSFSVAKHPPG